MPHSPKPWGEDSLGLKDPQSIPEAAAPQLAPHPMGQGLLTCCLEVHLPRGGAVGPLPSFVDTSHPKPGSTPRGQLRHVEVAVCDAGTDDLPLVLPCRYTGKVRWGQTGVDILSVTPTQDPTKPQGIARTLGTFVLLSVPQ